MNTASPTVRQFSVRSLDEYVAFVCSQVFSEHPASAVTRWADEWDCLFGEIGKSHPIDTVSLIFARWEFLGALFLGSTGKTSSKEANAYAKKFLVSVNQAYEIVEELSALGSIFSMLRNNPLHGYVPTALYDKSVGGVVTWWIGGTGIDPIFHLNVDPDGGLHVDATAMSRELKASMSSFAEYLSQDCDYLDDMLPCDRWRTALWTKYRPKHYGKDEWRNRFIECDSGRGVEGGLETYG